MLGDLNRNLQRKYKALSLKSVVVCNFTYVFRTSQLFPQCNLMAVQIWTTSSQCCNWDLLRGMFCRNAFEHSMQRSCIIPRLEPGGFVLDAASVHNMSLQVAVHHLSAPLQRDRRQCSCDNPLVPQHTATPSKKQLEVRHPLLELKR